MTSFDLKGPPVQCIHLNTDWNVLIGPWIDWSVNWSVE